MRSWLAAALSLTLMGAGAANPVARADEYTIYRDQASSDGTITLSPSVLANDTGGNLTAHQVTGTGLASNGIIKLQFSSGAFQPGNTVTGSYYAKNSSGNSNTAQYKIKLGNRAPQCRSDNYTVMAGSILDITGAGVLLNDADPDRDKLEIKAMPYGDGPKHGALTRVGDSGFKYVPTAGYSGQDSFRYRAADNPPGNVAGVEGECTGQVTINVRTTTASPSASPLPDETQSPPAPDDTESPAAAPPTFTGTKPASSGGGTWWLYLIGSLIFVSGMIALVFLFRRRGDQEPGTEPTLHFGPGDLH